MISVKEEDLISMNSRLEESVIASEDGASKSDLATTIGYLVYTAKECVLGAVANINVELEKNGWNAQDLRIKTEKDEETGCYDAYAEHQPDNKSFHLFSVSPEDGGDTWTVSEIIADALRNICDISEPIVINLELSKDLLAEPGHKYKKVTKKEIKISDLLYS